MWLAGLLIIYINIHNLYLRVEYPKAGHLPRRKPLLKELQKKNKLALIGRLIIVRNRL